MWYLRKFYGGNGGCLPPTDPRLLAMTQEQIDLDFEHILLDRNEGKEKAEVYVDGGYDDYDKESDDIDSRLSDIPAEYQDKLRKDINNEEEWEDV